MSKKPSKQAQIEKIKAELAEARAKVKEHDAWQKEYIENNPIYFFDSEDYGFPGPNPRQKDIIDAWLDPFYKTFTFTGGERSGKTTILTLIAIATMFGEYPWDNQMSRKGSPTRLNHLFTHTEPRKIRYIGQDWKEHIQDVVLPCMEKWWPKDRKVKRKGNGIIPDAEWKDLKTGSSLVILSNNQDPRVHRGWHGDLILYDEPPKREIYIANARGLVDRHGREFIAATLLEEPWIHQEIVNKKLENGKPDPMVYNVHIESRENIGYGIDQQGLDDYASKLTDDEKEAKLKGVPSYLSGIIFKDFKRKTHLRERFKIPRHYIVDIAIDTHPREKQAVLFMATAPDNRKWLVEEIWDNGDGTWIGENICNAIDYHHFTVNRIICDPLAKGDKNEPNTTYDKISDALLSDGYLLETAHKDWKSGILETKTYLKGPNNEPSLFIFDDLIRTIFEIESYMWDKETSKPIDKDDHMMENLGRLLLLGTKWFEPSDEIVSYVPSQEGRSAIGGY